METQTDLQDSPTLELSEKELEMISGGATCTTVTKYRLNGNIKSQSTTCTDS